MRPFSTFLLARRLRRGALAGLAAASLGVGGMAISAPPASAAPGHTLYVSPSATGTGADTNCATAKYSTVQSALNAAPSGATVYLCGTVPYAESVVIDNQNVTVAGANGAAIEAPANAAAPTTFFSSQGLVTPNSVVTVIGSSDVTLSGLTIEGPFQNTGCGGDDYGVLQVGGTMHLTDDSVLNIGAADQVDLGGCQYGVGVQVGRRYWPSSTSPNSYNTVDFAGSADIDGTEISGYQKNGITADGPGTVLNVLLSKVVGDGPSGVIAQNGIQISRGATGSVSLSTVSNNEYEGSSAFATGVVVYGGCGDPLDIGVQIDGNSFQNDDNAISVGNYDPTCSTAPSTPTNVRVDANLITKSDGLTNSFSFTAENGDDYVGGYQAAISDTGNHDEILLNVIVGTKVGSTDTAFGPETTPEGPFLAPIDIQTYPPVNTLVAFNAYDGHATNPPY